jgi:hypothetical protein
VARGVASPVAAPALASGVFDPLDPLVEWCAEFEAPIGLPGYATNSDSSSDSESAQLLSFLDALAHREAKNAGLSTGQFECLGVRSLGALIGAEP